MQRSIRHATGPLVAFASVHLRWGEPAVQSRLLSSALWAVSRATALVLAGDFNCTTLELAESVPLQLQRGSPQRTAACDNAAATRFPAASSACAGQ